ncbi:MAG TPA: hypothetical protein ENJ09_09605, partial [Planctomycetes bacterium]|nr:hypothetical protein [Planctomycetota bacterium]
MVPSKPGFPAKRVHIMPTLAPLCVLLALSPLSFSQSLGWGTVVRETKISQTSGGFGGTLLDDGGFGTELVALGDLDGDGLRELAVGAPYLPGGAEGGSIWILFPNADGTLHRQTQIAPGVGGFVGPTHREFGSGLAAPGDLDGDGTADLVAAAPVGNIDGVLWILFLNPDGTVKTERKLTVSAGANQDLGRDMTCVGDLDGNGTVDLAVTAPRYTGPTTTGAVYILFLGPGGTLLSTSRIATGEGGLGAFADGFGRDIARLGDLDGNGVEDLAVQSEQTLG